MAASPLTAGLLLTLVVTTFWLRYSPDPDAILRNMSTNLKNLARSPVRSFVASAFVLQGSAWLVDAAGLAVCLGALERRRGSLTAVGVFASGHVIATVLTEGGVYAGIRLGIVPRFERFQIDVGVSYGLWVSVAAAIALLPRRLRLPAATAGALWLFGALALNPGMTSIGHVLSLLIGLAWWPYLLRRAARPTDSVPPNAQPEFVLPAAPWPLPVRSGRGLVLVPSARIVAAPG